MQKSNAWNLGKHFQFALKSSKVGTLFCCSSSPALFFPRIKTCGGDVIIGTRDPHNVAPSHLALHFAADAVAQRLAVAAADCWARKPCHWSSWPHRVKLWTTMQPPKKGMEEISGLKLIETPFEKKNKIWFPRKTFTNISQEPSPYLPKKVLGPSICFSCSAVSEPKATRAWASRSKPALNTSRLAEAEAATAAAPMAASPVPAKGKLRKVSLRWFDLKESLLQLCKEYLGRVSLLWVSKRSE